jgi:hypothetical protein
VFNIFLSSIASCQKGREEMLKDEEGCHGWEGKGSNSAFAQQQKNKIKKVVRKSGREGRKNL